ncbi:hypothetical protein ACIOGZ_38990 [Kitasatospora sp. NPDC088160]|uniref:hypothetical protein n=1 Tax=Kitasatospora sp. NPDC088160 TaxID=3364072 RepID=UPI0037F26133
MGSRSRSDRGSHLSGLPQSASWRYVRPSRRSWPRALDGAPIASITDTLLGALLDLAAHLDPRGCGTDANGAVVSVLRLIVAAAYNTAEPGEEAGLLYVTPAIVGLKGRPVWLERRRAGGPITARFPADRC